VNAPEARRGGNIRRQVPTRQCHPGELRIERSPNPLRPELHARERAAQRCAILGSNLSWRDLELHHLPALRQDETRGIEDVAARRWHLARGELLSRRPRPPRVPLEELHVRRLTDHRESEHGER